MSRPDRLGGLFFEELILGSYLSKILPIFLAFTFINKKVLNGRYILINYFINVSSNIFNG